MPENAPPKKRWDAPFADNSVEKPQALSQKLETSGNRSSSISSFSNSSPSTARQLAPEILITLHFRLEFQRLVQLKR